MKKNNGKVSYDLLPFVPKASKNMKRFIVINNICQLEKCCNVYRRKMNLVSPLNVSLAEIYVLGLACIL